MSRLGDRKQADEAVRGTRKTREALDRRMPLGIQLDGDSGSITVDVEELPRDDRWDHILEINPYVSPETHEVDPFRSADITSWDVSAVVDGEWVTTTNHRCKVPVRLRQPGERLTAGKVDELCKLVRKRKAPKLPEVADDAVWFGVFLSDVQLGKSDGGGTPATLERVRASLDSVTARAKRLKPAGILLAEMGDILEGCYGFYPGQQWLVDLNYTEQLDLAVELMMSAIDGLAPLSPRLVVTFVPSNHSEIRSSKGNPITDKARDNFDLVIANAVTRILAANPDRYGHVEIVVPVQEGGDPFVVTVDCGGVMLGLSHGHQISGGAASRSASIDKWWQSHTWSDRARPEAEAAPSIADADICVVGHGHHFLMSQATGRLSVQCPALDGGSESFTAGTGRRSSAGLLAFEISDCWPMLANGFTIH